MFSYRCLLCNMMFWLSISRTINNVIIWQLFIALINKGEVLYSNLIAESLVAVSALFSGQNCVNDANLKNKLKDTGQTIFLRIYLLTDTTNKFYCVNYFIDKYWNMGVLMLSIVNTKVFWTEKSLNPRWLTGYCITFCYSWASIIQTSIIWIFLLWALVSVVSVFHED